MTPLDARPLAFETWNSCPGCGAEWKDPEPTDGLVHRTRLCAACADVRSLTPESQAPSDGVVK